MTYSKAGFGSYRIDISIKDHYDALNYALTNGINLIDTSANYADGRSEQLVAKVIEDLISEKKIKRDELTIVTKGGYIQGQNYKFASKLKQEGKPFEDVVEYSERLWHCISPGFLEDQISRQLHRLNQDYADVYLLHNPEYYLGWAENNKIDRQEAEKIYYERIRKAFEFLEKKVSEGKIREYGISSNTFALRQSVYDFTSLEKVLAIAESVSENHNFKTIQLPFNLIEAGAVTNKNQSGNTKTVLEFAFENKIKVLINRPLNAITSKGLVRLADFKWEAFQEKDFIKQIKLVGLMEDDLMSEKIPKEDLSEEDLKALKGILNAGKLIEENWKFFGSIEHFNDVLSQQFIPKISRLMDIADEKIKEISVKDFISGYIKEVYKLLNLTGNYYKMRADKRSKFIHGLINKYLEEKFQGLSLSQKTVLLLSSVEGINCVLTGMRKVSYAEDICGVMNEDKIKNAKEIIRFVSEEIERAEN
ncbi:MAG: aldo/keto reductase [Ignavibacteria bacterium]|nr:aldo/keto reductase [Ignavibacteria bacterium]